MTITIQKHRVHPIWKFYDEKKAYLGQILGTDKESMPTLAFKIADLLLGQEDAEYTKERLVDGSINIIKDGKRVAGIEKEFTQVGETIKANL